MRARLSCVPCRKRKIRCDERRPCGSCSVRGDTSRCSLPDGDEESKQTNSKRRRHEAQTPTLRTRLSGTDISDAISPVYFHLSQEEISRPLRSHELNARFAQVEDALRSLRSYVQPDQRLRNEPDDASGSQHQAASALPCLAIHSTSRLGPPINGVLLSRVVDYFPSRIDCEVLLQYLTSEADWLIVCFDHTWLLSIWSRLVYGAFVEEGETVLLATALANAALVLSESPFHLYKTSESPTVIYHRIQPFFLEYNTRTRSPSHTAASPTTSTPQRTTLKTEITNWLILVNSMDYLRFMGSFHMDSVANSLLNQTRRYVDAGFLDEETTLWRQMDPTQIELCRRAAWAAILIAQWTQAYSEGAPMPLPTRAVDIRVERPTWSLPRLNRPFAASQDFCGMMIVSPAPDLFRKALKNVAQTHRTKLASEHDSISIFNRLVMELSALGPEIGTYACSVRTWREQYQSILASSGRHDAAAVVTDHTTQALLHQGMALYEEISTWRQQASQTLREPVNVDFEDILACRCASQAAIVHIGVRHFLNVLLNSWVTFELINDSGSLLLTRLQRAAFANARDTVRAVPLTRALLTSGRTTFFEAWPVHTFLRAAVVLAVPLLGHQAIQQEAQDVDSALGKQAAFGNPFAGLGEHDHQHSRIGSPLPTPDANTAVTLAVADLKTLAAEILAIMELLPLFKMSVLGKEAQDRLGRLIGRYKIGQQSLDPQEYRRPANHDPRHATATDTDRPFDVPTSLLFLDPGQPSGMAFQSVQSAQEPDLDANILESLLCQDDAWWQQIFQAT